MKPWDRIYLIRETALSLSRADGSLIDLILERSGVDYFIRLRCKRKDEDRLSYCMSVLSNVGCSELANVAAYLGIRGHATRMWELNAFRLFLSHHSSYKNEAGELKNSLEAFAVSAFVAHVDIEPIQLWSDEIESALYTAHALVALLTNDFHPSQWTDQEIGVAIGRGLLVVPIKIGTDPYGLMGKYQAIAGSNRTISEIAADLFNIFLNDGRSKDQMVRALVLKLENSRSFEETQESLDLLDRIEYQDRFLVPLWRLRLAATENPHVDGAPGALERVDALVDRLWW